MAKFWWLDFYLRMLAALIVWQKIPLHNPGGEGVKREIQCQASPEVSPFEFELGMMTLRLFWSLNGY